MPKRKRPEPDIIRLENQTTEELWRFRVNLTEADVRLLSDDRVPEWLKAITEFWCRDNPKPSDVPPKQHEDTEAVA